MKTLTEKEIGELFAGTPCQNHALTAWQAGARDFERFRLGLCAARPNPFDYEREPWKFAAYAEGWITARELSPILHPA